MALYGTWIEYDWTPKVEVWNHVKCTHEVWNSTPLGLSFFGDAEVEKEWLVTLATINPSEVEYEDPFCVTLGTTICSGTGIIDPCLPWRTLCLVHGDWPSNWRSRPLEDVGWGQGLLLNSWHLSQSPTVSHFKIFRSNQHLVKWSDAEINYGKSHQILKIKAISS